MDIAIIGSGRVGSALGAGWASRGHRVAFGVRDPGGVRARAAVDRAGGGASAADVRAAADGAEVIVLTVPWGTAQEVVRGLGDLSGKVVIDCTNPVAPDLKGLSVGGEDSAAERIARAAAGARVVKAFNTVAAERMANPLIDGRALTLFICGDDEEANRTVANLAAELGFEPAVTGPLRHARYLEPLAMLWIEMALHQGYGRDFGFELIRARR